MELVVPKKDLLRLVARCQGVADKKSAMPALSNVLLVAEGSVLHVSATDMYLSITGTTNAEVATSGSVALPARELFERVKAMPEGPVQIAATAGAQTTIKAAASPRRFTVHGIPGGDFPPLPRPDERAAALSMPVELLGKQRYLPPRSPGVVGALLTAKGDLGFFDGGTERCSQRSPPVTHPRPAQQPPTRFAPSYEAHKISERGFGSAPYARYRCATWR